MSARFWSQEGQHDRWRHEKATKNSSLQSGQRTRAKPSLGSPHFRNFWDRSADHRPPETVLLLKPIGINSLELREMATHELEERRSGMVTRAIELLWYGSCGSIPHDGPFGGEKPKDWIEIHKDDLLADWKLAVEGKTPFKIKGLDE